MDWVDPACRAIPFPEVFRPIPPSAAPAPFVVGGAARLPEAIPVRLVRRNVVRPTDALLSTRRSFSGWLRTYLMHAPPGESMFLAGGGRAVSRAGRR